MNFQQTHNALTCQKNVAVYFKDVKTEETISSRPRPDASGNYQICDDNFFQTENHHSTNPLLQRPLTQ